MREKIIRDPVHDVIAFRIDRPGDALLFSLVNTPEVQRLRRVRQLGMASLAYPGADHSRYSHSLGVMETARKVLARLRAHFDLDPRRELVCLVACLLHDLGHGPFSHVFERVSGIRHEEVTRRLIGDPDSHVHRALAAHDAALPQEVLDFIACLPHRTFYNDVLASQLDADRFDYLLRDNLMTGSQYGAFDLGWLLQAITLDPSGQRLAVSAKAVSAVEDYLQSRYHMYRNVYFHKVVRSAEGMVKLALQRARRLAVQDRLAWPPRDHAVCKSLLGQQLSAAEFADFDDVSILQCFKVWSAGDDGVLASICKGLLYRRLFKVVDLSAIPDGRRARDALLAAEQALVREGGDRSYDLFFDEPANTPYRNLTSDADDPGGAGAAGDFCPEGGILVVDASGRATDFAQASPLVHTLGRQLMFRRIHVAEPWRDLVRAAVAPFV